MGKSTYTQIFNFDLNTLEIKALAFQPLCPKP